MSRIRIEDLTENLNTEASSITGGFGGRTNLITLPDAQEFGSQGITLPDAQEFKTAGITLPDAQEFKGAGITLPDAQEFRRR